MNILGFYKGYIKRHLESISSNNITNIIIREYSEIKLYRYQNQVIIFPYQ
jgi:hypothetical protein